MSYVISEELQSWVEWTDLEHIPIEMEKGGTGDQLKSGAPEHIKIEFEEWQKRKKKQHEQLLLSAWLIHDHSTDTHIISLKKNAPQHIKKLFNEFKKQDHSKITKQKIKVL